MKGIVMAGGEGRRLRPLTGNIPKPMVPVLGQPCITYITSLLRRHGITETALTLQYMPESILRLYQNDGDISFFIENKPLGTAGSVKNAQPFLDDDFIVISGDCICDFDLKDAIRYHYEKKAMATLVLTPVQRPLEYGVVVCNEEGEVCRFIEKPDWSQVYADTVNTGIYIFSKQVLDYIPKNQKFDFAKDLFPILLKTGMPMYGYEAEGYWCDIGDIASYMKCNFDMQEGKINLPLPDKEENSTGKDCHIHPSVKLGRRVILGDHVTISAGCTLEDCIVGACSILEEDCTLKGCLLGKEVHLFPGVSGEHAVVGDRVQIGRKTVLRPGVKIWPDRWVNEDSVVDTNVVNSDFTGLFDKDSLTGGVKDLFTASFCARLGGACASLKEGARLVIMGDGSSASRAICQAIGAGAALSGGACCRAGDGFEAMLRYASVLYGADCGIFVKGVGEWVRITFCSGEGVSLNRETERKIDAAFTKDEYKRADADNVRENEPVAGLFQLYTAAGSNAMDFGRQKISVLTVSPAVQRAMEEMIRMAGGVLSEDDGALKLFLDDTGSNLRIGDANDTIYDADQCRALGLKAALELQNPEEVALSFDSPQVLTKLAEKAHKKILRVLSCPADESDQQGRRRISTQHFMKDGLFCASLIFTYLNRRNITLATAMAALPEFAVVRELAPVTPGIKGELMKALLSDAKKPADSLSEGIFMQYPLGGVHIYPCRANFFRIMAEANKMETAQEICDYTKEKIAAFTREKTTEWSREKIADFSPGDAIEYAQANPRRLPENPSLIANRKK